LVRLFLPSACVGDKTLTISGEPAHYLLSVLRCRTGDMFIAFNGRGDCFRMAIDDLGKRTVTASVLESFPCNLESGLHTVLVQGLLKGAKMDVVVQKATELGMNEFMPVVTERSQLRDTRKVKRWQKIAEEASRQSGRSVVPLVHEPIEFEHYAAMFFPNPERRGFIFYEEEGTSLKDLYRMLRGNERTASEGAEKADPETRPLHSLHICIGPEGGFTRDEVRFAQGMGFAVVSLGKRILKADTAAISAMTLVQFLFGDMG